MKIIFDFDNTLFSTTRFVSVLRKAFEDLGIEENLFEETFEKSKKDSKGYNPEEQFRLIVEKKSGLTLDELEESFDGFLSKVPQLLYSDVFDFLKKLEDRFDFYILSFGREDFQRKKIEKSGISNFFKEIYITGDKNKVSVLKRFFTSQDKVVFVDDRPLTLSRIKERFPEIITVRMNRGEGKYRKHPDNSGIDFSIKNLKELEGLLLTKF